MDLPSTLGAPRIVYFGQDVYFVRPMSLEGMAIILAWLDDIIPGRVGRTMPPKFSDEASQAALTSSVGQIMLVYVALRDQGVNYAMACELSARLGDVGHVRLLEVLFAHRRTVKPSFDQGKDIAETWCSKGMAQLVQTIGYRETLSLSFDQYEWLQRDGDLEDENPAYSTEALTQVVADFHAKWGDKIASLNAGQVVTNEAPAGG